MSTIEGLPMELVDTRKTWREEYAAEGTRRWLCLWENRFGSWAPRIGISKFSDGIPSVDRGKSDDKLICRRIDYTGHGAGKIIYGTKYPYDTCELVVKYEDKRPYDSTAESFSTVPRMIEIGYGRSLPDGTAVDIPIMMPDHMGVWHCPRTFPHDPNRRFGLMSKIGCVNRSTWRNYPAETVRFDGADIRTSFSREIKLLLDYVTFKFTIDRNGHNNILYYGEWVPVTPPPCPTIDLEPMLMGLW